MITTINKDLKTRLKSFACVLAMGVFAIPLAGCSTTAEEQITAGDIEIQDPFEEGNRVVFAFNDAVDDVVIHPIVTGYRAVVPQPGRTGLRNFLSNLKSPVYLANEVLQGDFNGAGNVMARATINTFAGAGGLVDIAGYEGFEKQPEDFGQTLAVWGVGHGPYLVLPLLGPSSLRDYAGFFVDSYADPLKIMLDNSDDMEIQHIRTGLQVLAIRDELMDVLKDLEKSSIDYYAAIRSAYYQRRDAEVKDEDASQMQVPDFSDAGE
jgi:phospholipid-binding lipoprotein MlaA